MEAGGFVFRAADFAVGALCGGGLLQWKSRSRRTDFLRNGFTAVADTQWVPVGL